MTAPIKTCDYCGATGEMPTFMNGETICYTCLHVLPKTLPEARQELMRLRAVLAVVAQPKPIVPDGWLRAIDEALVTAHTGVANAHDTYEQAKAKLDNLVGFLVDAATDPAVNGGWKLMPIEPTQEMIDHVIDERLDALAAGKDHTFIDIYKAALAAAPEAKP